MTKKPAPVSAVHLYCAVAGVTELTEVLSPCGHEVPRYDTIPGFAVLEQQVGARLFPRSRLCPSCFRPGGVTVGTGVQGPPQLAADWTVLSERMRAHVMDLLASRSLKGDESADLPRWRDLSPERRGRIALACEMAVRPFGLTFHEFAHLSESAPPRLSPTGYARLTASPEEKARRRRSANQRRHLRDR